MLVSWTIGRKLYTCIGVIGALLLITSAVSVWVTGNLSAAVEHNANVITKRLELALRVSADAKDVKGSEQTLITAAYRSDPSKVAEAKQDVQRELEAFHRNVMALRPMLVTDEGRAALAAIDDRINQWTIVDAEAQKLLDAGKTQEAALEAQRNSAPLIEGIDRQADAIVEMQHKVLEEAVQNGLAQHARAQWTLLTLFVLSVVSGVMAIRVVRTINRRLRKRAYEMRDGAQQVVSAATQVASSAQSLSKGASEQAASLEETSASMEEMASMTRQNAENTQQAASLMAEVDTRVKDSNRALGNMVLSMTSIQDSSAKVARIIKTIDEIAFQTNILALNAAVEAARAGEAGMGFAVVADEVRNLAQRSAQAAKDTAALIEESSANAAQGTATVGHVAEAITAITASVSRVKGLVDEVSVASRQQAQGIDQVTQALAQMEKVTQVTAATAEESAAASEELNAQAETTMVAVSKIETMVGLASDMETAEPVAALAAPRAARARIASMTPREPRPGGPSPKVTGPKTAEEQIPLGTGTYGKF
jgi:methyl-accepting chemotaxis protein/methyl-accepting chemotaxis protein-1 (serine sensor receptor)